MKWKSAAAKGRKQGAGAAELFWVSFLVVVVMAAFFGLLSVVVVVCVRFVALQLVEGGLESVGDDERVKTHTEITSIPRVLFVISLL